MPVGILLLVLLLGVIVPPCDALASPSTSKSPQETFSKLQSKLKQQFFPSNNKDPQVTQKENLLQELDLKSSTEPKPFSFAITQIPDLLTASFPVRIHIYIILFMLARGYDRNHLRGKVHDLFFAKLNGLLSLVTQLPYLLWFFSFLKLVLRLGSGALAEGYSVKLGPRNPSQQTSLVLNNNTQLVETCNPTSRKQNLPLILYEFEGCPFCRKVREAVSILSLEVTFRPCPAGDRTFRQEIKTNYGDKASFPYLVDPNTGVQMFESDAIVKYLFQIYGATGDIPWTLAGDNNAVVTLTAGLGMLPRALLGKGSKARESNPPPTPVILWSYEGSPFCKLVRERLVELGIPHTQISCPRGSTNRQRQFEITGKPFQVPYLQDPNTRVDLFESAAIIEYLEKVYGVPQPRVKYL